MTQAGDFEIMAVEGNRQRLDGGAMFGNAPRAVWERWLPADERGRVELACRGMLVKKNGVTLLCEAGIGAFFEPKLADRYGVQSADTHKLLESLEAVGVGESGIDWIVLSHLHFDHAGGILSKYEEGKESYLLFPKARYLVGEQAWKRACQPHMRDRASFIPGLTDKLKASGRLTIIPERAKSIPGLWEKNLSLSYSDGHTPGHLHVCVDKTFFCGDLIPGRPWVHLPITMGYDRCAEKLIDEKQEMYRQLEGYRLFFCHDPEVAFAHLALKKGRYLAV